MTGTTWYALIALIALAGCGDASSSDYSSAEQVAEAIGCTGLQADESMVEEYVCDMGGQSVHIIATTESDIDSLVEVGADFGVTYASVSDEWAISSMDRATLEAAAEKVDAEVAG